jgi:hypothetical protein
MAARARLRSLIARLVVPAVLAGLAVAVPESAGGAAGADRVSTAGALAAPSRAWSGHRDSGGAPAPTKALASTTGGVSAATAVSGESELVSLRTQTSRTFVEPDGTRRLVAATAPVNYKDPNGAWQPINDSLVADAAAGFVWRNVADSYAVEFPADLASGPVRVNAAGQWVAFRLRGASGAGVVSGNTVTLKRLRFLAASF